jgi:hypothetical protein
MFGDETWLKLFPGLFMRHDGVSSFFVSLLHVEHICFVLITLVILFACLCVCVYVLNAFLIIHWSILWVVPNEIIFLCF